MTRILIPRSDNTSAKTIEASDFEKYFSTDIIADYFITGFCVSAQCPNVLAVDIAAGAGRLNGLYVCNSTSCSITCLTVCDVNYIWATICRDPSCEPEAWSITKTLTACVPTDSMLIGTATTNATTVTAVCNLLRNTASGGGGSEWMYGDGGDGCLTVCCGTCTLTTVQYYCNVTIDACAILTGTSPQIMYVKNTLTVNGSLNMDGKGSCGAAAKPGGTPGSGGAGGFPGGTPGSNGGAGIVGLCGCNAVLLCVAGADGGVGVGCGMCNNPSGVGCPGGAGAGGQGGKGAVWGGVAGDGGGSCAYCVCGGSGGCSDTLSTCIGQIIQYMSKDTRADLLGAGGGSGASGTGGGGGGGGGGTGTSGTPGGPGGSGGLGGAGGNGGGTLIVIARRVIVGSCGVISSNGAVGSVGGNGTNGNNGSNAGGPGNGAGGGGAGGAGGSGGAGGNGGFLWLIYSSLSNAGTVEAVGGIGGTSGSGGTGGTGGVSTGPGSRGAHAGGNGGTGPPGSGSTGGVGLVRQLVI